MDRYLNEQFRQWAAHSDAGDTVQYPYLHPVQKTWSPAGQPTLVPPLTTFNLHEARTQKHSRVTILSPSLHSSLVSEAEVAA